MTVPPGARGRLTVLYFKGEFDVKFTADVTLQAKTKVAPSEWRSTATPTLDYVKDDMLKAVLKVGGFDKPDSQVNYGVAAKFQETGTLEGQGGFTLKVQAKPTAGDVPAMSL